MKFKNFTGHELSIHDGSFVMLARTVTVYPVAGPANRLEVDREQLGSLAVDGTTTEHAVVRSVMGSPTGLPKEVEDTILIVSAEVAEHPSIAARQDIAYPGSAIRDAAGKVIGAEGLCAGPGLAAKMRQAEQLKELFLMSRASYLARLWQTGIKTS